MYIPAIRRGDTQNCKKKKKKKEKFKKKMMMTKSKKNDDSPLMRNKLHAKEE